MAYRRCWLKGLGVIFVLVLAVFSYDPVRSQGLPSSPYNASSVLRQGGLDLMPSNPLGLPGSSGGPATGSDSICLSSGMLRDLLGPIPNLQFGYLYSSGSGVSTGRATIDYLRPINLGSDSVVFGEAHGEFTNFWKTFKRLWAGGGTDTAIGSFDTRTDISLGGGYRRILSGNTLLGVNGFYDATHLGQTWYSSGSIGLEMAALIGGADAIDLTFNWYGNLFRADVLANAFRKGPSNFDLEAGYSHQLYHGGPDLRLFATGYQFTAGPHVYGWRAGGEVKTKDGMFSVKYEAGHDRVNRTYHTVGGFVNVGLEPERLLSGESPFVMPEPIFKSPRNLRRWLSRPVQRNTRQVAAVVTTKSIYFVLEIDPAKAPLPARAWPVTLFAGTLGQVTFDHSPFDYGNVAWTLSVGGDTSSLPPTINVTITGDTDAATYYLVPVPVAPGSITVTLTAPSYSFTQPDPTGRGVPWAFDSSPGPFPIVRTMRISDNSGHVPDLVIQGTFR